MGTRYFSVITSNINSPQHHSQIKLNFQFDVQKCEIRGCRERDSLPKRAAKPKSVSFFARTCFIYILISRQRYRAVLLGSHVDRRSIRFGTRAHPQTRTYAHIYVHSHTCSCFHPSPSHCRRYPRVLQRNSANHSRAYSDACHNERRATFCFGPVGRKYRPF